MIYKYIYSITFFAEVQKIIKKNKFNKKKFNDEVWKINADILNEYFYYAIENPNIESTYDTDLKIYIKSNSYEINHKIFSNKNNIIDTVNKLYSNVPNINEIFELSGCDVDEIYEQLQIQKLEIKNTTIVVELLELTNDFDNSFEIFDNTTQFKVVNVIQVKIQNKIN